MMTAFMDMEQGLTTPFWIKIAAGIGAAWYAFGCVQFWLTFTMNPAVATANGTMTEAHASAIATTPGPIWASFALASFLGLVGAALLLNGSRRAGPVFGVSLACAVIYYAWVFGVSGTGGARPGQELVIALVVISVTLSFCQLSRRG